MSAVGIVQAMVVTGITLLFFAAVGSIRYRITPLAIEVLLLTWVVRRIPLDSIEEVHRRGALLHESWSGPRFWNAVTLRRRSGLLRSVILTPDDPERFVADLARILAERRDRTGS